MPFVLAIYDEEGGGVGNNTKADTTAKVRIYAVNHLHALHLGCFLSPLHVSTRILWDTRRNASVDNNERYLCQVDCSSNRPTSLDIVSDDSTDYLRCVTFALS